MGFGYSSGPAVTVTQPAVFVARLSPMLDPDEALHYLDFLESRAVAGEDEPPRDAASTALAAAPHALPSRTAPALEVSASKMDDGLPSPTAAELEDQRVRDAVALLGRLIAADPREIAKKKARKRARRAMRAPPRVSAKSAAEEAAAEFKAAEEKAAEFKAAEEKAVAEAEAAAERARVRVREILAAKASASAKLLVLPAWLLPARPEIAPVKMPNIAAPVDYATLLDREQAAFDAAEFTPATADPDAPPPDVGFGSTRNPLVVQLRNLRRRSWLSRVRGSRWTGTDDVDLVTTYNNARNAAQERRRRADLTADCVHNRYARRVPISASS